MPRKEEIEKEMSEGWKPFSCNVEKGLEILEQDLKGTGARSI
jgi:hypothetical protein